MTKKEKVSFEIPEAWANFNSRNKAFRAGYVAFIAGKFINPFNETAQFMDNREWQRGWNRSYKTQQEKCNAN